MRTIVVAPLLALGIISWHTTVYAQIGCEPRGGQPTVEFGFSGAPARVHGAPGTVLEVEVFATLQVLESVDDYSIQGWSFSILVAGAEVIDFGVDEDLVLPGPRGPVEVFPALFTFFSEGEHPDDESLRGVVGAVAGPAYNRGDAINPREKSPVLRIVLAVSIPEDGSDSVVELSYVDGLQGSGQPIDNVFTHQGNLACPRIAGASFVAMSRSVPFARGDTNEDGRRDISDAAVILNYLFRGTVDTACPDAFDTNDDGILELTDAVALFNWLFRGGPAPAAPFEDCGLDPSEDDFACRHHEACS